MKPNMIPAREIKRRGIGAVDELLDRGPVHVIQRDEPVYVVMTEARYQELVEAEEEAAVARVNEALKDVEAGRARKVTAEELIKEFDLE